MMNHLGLAGHPPPGYHPYYHQQSLPYAAPTPMPPPSGAQQMPAQRQVHYPSHHAAAAAAVAAGRYPHYGRYPTAMTTVTTTLKGVLANVDDSKASKGVNSTKGNTEKSIVPSSPSISASSSLESKKNSTFSSVLFQTPTKSKTSAVMKVPTKPTSEKESVEDQAAKIAKKDDVAPNRHEQQQEVENDGFENDDRGEGIVMTINEGGRPVGAVKAKENIRPEKNSKKATTPASVDTTKQHPTAASAGGHPILGLPPHPPHAAQHGLYHPYHSHPHCHHPHYAPHMAPPPNHGGPPSVLMSGIQQTHLYRHTHQQQPALHPPPGISQQPQSHRTQGKKQEGQQGEKSLQQHVQAKDGGINKAKDSNRSSLISTDDENQAKVDLAVAATINASSTSSGNSAKGGLSKWSKEEVRRVFLFNYK